MTIGQYCAKCQKIRNVSGKFCEDCGSKLNPLPNSAPEPTISEMGAKLGKKIGQAVVETTVNAGKVINQNIQNHQSKIRSQPAYPQNQNYKELTAVFRSMESLGRFVIGATKGLTIFFFLLGLVAFVSYIGRSPGQAVGLIIFPIIPSIVICLPLYILGMIMTALPQIVLLIKDCRDFLEKIYLQQKNI